MTRTEWKEKNIGIIGPGRVGSAFALGLFNAGWRIGRVFGRRIEYAKSLAAKVKAGISEDLREVVARTDIMLLTVPDDIICDMAREIAKNEKKLANKFFFHTSGVLEAGVLSPLQQKGGIIGSIHPLQTLADRDTGRKALIDSWFALDGEERAVLLGEEIVKALSGKAFSLRQGTKPLYHAAACIASNYLVTLEYIASSLLQLTGISGEDFYSLFGPLLEKTMENIRTKGVRNALTGPVSRGDVGTISTHLNKIQDLAPEFLTFYKIMLRHTVDLASECGYIEKKQVHDVYKLTGEDD